MTRRWPALVTALAAVVSVVASVGWAGGAEAAFGREFRAAAKAFPIEPDPGQNQQSFAIRPLSAEAGAASTPMGANGRAAMFDMGFIENQFPPPEESFARCDTVSPNVPESQTRSGGAVLLQAHCNTGPGAEVRADGASPAAFFPPEALEPLGISGGLIASRSSVDASGAAVVAETVSGVSDLSVGPLHVEQLRFRSRAVADGEPGGASTDWSVDAMAADVGGVPVVIGTGGVRVDEQQVPPALVGDATRAVQEGFARSGGFIDVRILEPARFAADDGSAARVRGGALRILMTSNDNPADRYFLGLTLLGGEASVSIGAPRVQPLDLSPFTTGGAITGAPLDARAAPPVVRGSRVAAPAPGQAAAGSDVTPPRVDLATATAERRIPAASDWWALPLTVGLALGALVPASARGPLAPARRRVLAWWDVTAERFVRG